MRAHASLADDLDTEICVVGAGIAGLMTAWSLLRQGRNVIVLEAGAVGGGETARTTAHLASALDDGFRHLARLFGADGARTAYESHAHAIDVIEALVTQEKIDCDFTRLDGYLFTPSSESSALEDLDHEYNAALQAGAIVERLSHPPLDSLSAGQCLRFANQAQFHPLKFVAGLTDLIARLRGLIYTNTFVSRLIGGDRPYVQTQEGRIITARTIVITTNTPIGDNLVIHTRQAPHRTYVIGASVPWEAVPRALYWDTLDPYHYVRLKSARTPENRNGSDVLIIGGEDHRSGSGDESDRFTCLEQWAAERFPISTVDFRWSGMVFEPSDSLGFIGPDNAQKNVFIATGDSGHGITHGVIAGILLTDLIAGRTNSWAKLYDPSRVSLSSAPEYVKQNIDVAANLGRWLTPGEVSERAQIGRGSGAVLRDGLAKRAVYRDSTGALHEFSAVCPHLGCLVAWNNTESTWDCPCHGSRFDRDGQVIHGPATSDLEKV
ncbi:MAG TPA: FAD-dependent oxidoreductase [Bryobacteraceae bacterium]|nr:FAD-dependent oxidoreductase [Bryobacteraceae bacterium]